MIISCVREYHWSPETINKMFLDADDWMGIETWYNDIKYLAQKYKT